MVRLLDQVWPRHDSEQERIPRQFGRFSIMGELGRGGFGVVYLAEDPLLKRKVALKLPRLGILSGTESWRRFLREAQAASRLDHPNVIPLLEAGTIGPVGYIVSAYVAGPSLEQWLRHQQRQPRPAGVHRLSRHWHAPWSMPTSAESSTATSSRPTSSCTPPNARAIASVPLVPGKGATSESWVPRICDFGMAKLREAEGDETRSRIACGSPSYMAPEQAEARQSEIGARDGRLWPGSDPLPDIQRSAAILRQERS